MKALVAGGRPSLFHRGNAVLGVLFTFFMLLLSKRAICAVPDNGRWIVQLEEPTGLYPRESEVVPVPLSRLGGHRDGFQVLSPDGQEVPWQVSGNELLFPASIVPGELPRYRVSCCQTSNAILFKNRIVVRRIGMKRVEMGNSRFRILVDHGIPAITEAYSLTADEHKSLNMVDTTPDDRKAFIGDVHESDWKEDWVVPVPGVAGPHDGWSSLGSKGPMESVQILESGPLRGRVRMLRAQEEWEFMWSAESPAILWKAIKGFRLLTISCFPFLPFDRFVGGSEYDWPTGPGESEPPETNIGVRNWRQPPGGHVVYYRHGENYGALGLVSLDPELIWTGLGTHKVLAERMQGESQIAITFPRWKDGFTALEARREYRVLKQPLLVKVLPDDEKDNGISRSISPTEREVRPMIVKVSGPSTPYIPETLSLDGEWELAWAEKGAGPPSDGWKRVKVPGNVQVQWLEPSKIYTPEAEWISSKEWWYRKSFALPAKFNKGRVFLCVDASDYYTDIFLNGKYLLRHEGYMDPYSIEVHKNLREKQENQLLVRVWTPVNYYWKHRSYTIKGSYGGVDQKPDDITPMGISRSIYLRTWQGSRITDVAVDTRLTDLNGAEIEVHLMADRLHMESGYRWELTLSPRNFTPLEYSRWTAPVTEGKNQLVLPVANPQLWWTRDHGKPNLYNLEIKLLDPSGRILDGQSLPVGIREIEKIGWTWYLNRKRFFVRGTNYYYHLYMAETNRAFYQKDFELISAMNLNLVRVHCHFSNHEFYDLADELGILVWQDFLESWYPEDRRFSLQAARLYDPLIRYARNHACLAIWVTSDEESFENYRDLTKHLAARPFFLDPQKRAVHRSTGRFGDSHVYHGWYDGSIWDYKSMESQFVSELGATGMPNYETLMKYMPDVWPIKDHAAEWIFRRLQIKEAMRAWGDPGNLSLQEYIPITQNYVARLFQIALERARRLKYHPFGGICHFHAMDIWPSVTMAAIDFDRKPTKVYYTVQRSFAPLLASLEYEKDRWIAGEIMKCGLWAINDYWESFPESRITWRIVQTISGKVLQEGSYSLDIQADSAKRIGEVSWQTADPGSYVLIAGVTDRNGKLQSENSFEFTVLTATAPNAGSFPAPLNSINGPR